MLEVVARGRYGEVFKAIYRESIVAVKVLFFNFFLIKHFNVNNKIV